MIRLLINCYYDGMTQQAAIDFITRCYGDAPTQKHVDKASQAIKTQTGRDWPCN